MSQDANSNCQLSSSNSGNGWSPIATRPNDNVRVSETVKKETVVTPRRSKTIETRTRTVVIKPQQKRKAGKMQYLLTPYLAVNKTEGTLAIISFHLKCSQWHGRKVNI